VAVAPDRHALVSPQVAGRLLRVEVQEGSAVRAGDVVATVESQPTRDAVIQAQAGVSQAQVAAQAADVTQRRTEQLAAHGVASRQEVEDATARTAGARSALTAARAALSLAQRNLGLATVRAPIDGVVLRLVRATGELVDGTPATPVAELADPRALEFVASARRRTWFSCARGSTARRTSTRCRAVGSRWWCAPWRPRST
jgi:multidrug efflux system membrane fusion protein